MRAAKRAWRPIYDNSAVIGLMNTGQNADERRLAGAVFADQRVDFTEISVEIDIVECARGTELLGQSLDACGGCHAHARCSAHRGGGRQSVLAEPAHASVKPQPSPLRARAARRDAPACDP